MYGTLSPMIVPHKCCFIWLHHLGHLCISTTLKASGLSIIAIKLGLFKAKLFRCLKSLDRLVCHVLLIQLVQWIYYSPIWIYLFVFPNRLKILMKTSFEILDVAKWFQPSKIYFLGSRQQFVLWYLFIYLFIFPIRSLIMGNSLKKCKILFHKIVDFDIDYYFLYWKFDN
jgi:hypothetical protein